MNTCDTCKWWGASDGTVSEFFREFGYKVCSGAEQYDDKTRTYCPDGAEVDGFEMGSSPVIITGPKFGCVHWEKKD